MSRRHRQILLVFIVLLMAAAALIAVSTKRDIDTTYEANVSLATPPPAPAPNASMSYRACSDTLPTPTVHVIHDVKVTFYCCEEYAHICNSGWPWLTASGTYPTPYTTCAVDPDVIPLGSSVTVLGPNDSVYNLIAEDTGGGIRGNEIDIAVKTHWAATQMGVFYADVIWTYEQGGGVYNDQA